MELINRLVAGDLYYFLNEDCVIDINDEDGDLHIYRIDSETEVMYYPYEKKEDLYADIKELLRIVRLINWGE